MVHKFCITATLTLLAVFPRRDEEAAASAAVSELSNSFQSCQYLTPQEAINGVDRNQ
jgi:hypothetical protein